MVVRAGAVCLVARVPERYHPRVRRPVRPDEDAL